MLFIVLFSTFLHEESSTISSVIFGIFISILYAFNNINSYKKFDLLLDD